jgi:hypothetical protein
MPKVPLNARLLKTLEGVPLDLDEGRFMFERSATHLPAARAGGEGYAIPVVDVSSGRRHVLKTYHLPTPERRTRMTFLSLLPLEDIFQTFAAAPGVVVEKDFEFTSAGGAVNTARIEGYLASLIEGETFAELICSGWDPAPDVRMRLAAQLCNSVRVLEGGGLVHGDLSAANMMIEAHGSGEPRIQLIDYDGFYHASAALIPCTDQDGGRGWGSNGYRSASYQAMDEHVVVKSDRVAMALLVLELGVFRTEDIEVLGRDTLVDQVDIDARAPQLPADIVARWPEGWALTQRAIAADPPEAAPSPSEWCAALARWAVRSSTTASEDDADAETRAMTRGGGLPPLPLLIREANQPDRRVRITRHTGTFAAVSHRLAWLSYVHGGETVKIQGKPPGDLFVRIHGKVTKLAGTIDVTVGSGDTIQWDDLEILVG